MKNINNCNSLKSLTAIAYKLCLATFIMAEKTKHGYDKCLRKKIKYKNNIVTIYLYRGYDLIHGKGWFSHSYFDTFDIGFGFQKTNKLTAVRKSLNVPNG